MRPKAHLLGRRVASRRRELHWTQETLAERADVSIKTVQGIEQGRTEPSLTTALKLAEVLGVPLPDLVGGPRERKETPLDTLLRQLEADLRRLPIAVVRNVAAIVRALRGGP